MTGGAFGSLIAQWLKLSDAERTTLLVAGAAAGMSATFAAPLAAILLAVELLLFEWRPRSLVPVAVASITAAHANRLARPRSAVPMTSPPDHLDRTTLLVALTLGILVGFASAGLSRLMYGFEDVFEYFGERIHLPCGGPPSAASPSGSADSSFPRGLGVGYDNIAEAPPRQRPSRLLVGLLVAKSLMWAFSLSSGTSGGVLAPLLMIGATGEFLAHLAHLSGETQALWALMGMGAMLSGALGVPLTAILFSLELTHAFPRFSRSPSRASRLTWSHPSSCRAPSSPRSSAAAAIISRASTASTRLKSSLFRSHDPHRTPTHRRHHPPRHLRLHRRDLPRRRRKDGHRQPQLTPRHRSRHQRNPRHSSPCRTSSADARNPCQRETDRERVFSTTR